MSIPPVLNHLIYQRQFWTDWVGDNSLYYHDQPCPPEYDELSETEIWFPVSFDAGLELSIDAMFAAPATGLDFTPPGLPDTLPLGWDDLACSHLYCLRWDELDLILRATMLAGADWDSMHTPLLLLHRFAPICDDDDAAMAYPLLEAAWKSLAVVPPKELRRFMQYTEMRGSELEWLWQEGFGWSLQNTFTLRSPDPSDYDGLRNWTGVFPSHQWNDFLSIAEETWNAAVERVAQVDGQAELESACDELLNTGDMRWAATIADGLQSAGLCERAFVVGLQNATDIVDICWILDALLGEERGSTLHRHLDGAVPPFRERREVNVEVILFKKDRKRRKRLAKVPHARVQQLVSSIRQDLRERELGDVLDEGGGSSSDDEETGLIEVTLIGDYDSGLSVIRDHLANHGLVDRATINELL